MLINSKKENKKKLLVKKNLTIFFSLPLLMTDFFLVGRSLKQANFLKKTTVFDYIIFICDSNIFSIYFQPSSTSHEGGRGKNSFES